MPDRGIDALTGVMCQHDFEGNRIFQHRNMRKWSFYDNPQTHGFLFENECVEYIHELKHLWSPAADTPATPEDTAAASRLDGKMFEYHRVGYDHRPVCLRRDGIFAEGAATCEYYWTIRDSVMAVAAEDGSRTMELRPAKHGIWEGQWLDHEKMPVLLVP